MKENTAPSRRALAGRRNTTLRWHGADDPRTLAAETDLKAAQLEQRIRQTVDAAPALTVEQKARLAVLLLGGRS